MFGSFKNATRLFTRRGRNIDCRVRNEIKCGSSVRVMNGCKVSIAVTVGVVVVTLCFAILTPHRPAAAANRSICGSQEWQDHPALCGMLDHADRDLDGFVRAAHDWAARHGMLVDTLRSSTGKEQKLKVGPSADGTVRAGRRLTSSTTADEKKEKQKRQQQQQLPVVFAHGMGDSCFNDGMQRITQHVGKLLGDDVYAVCIPTGDNRKDDTRNGYFLNMDASVRVFAAKVKEHPRLARGFHAIGFSQGNNVIRGYIAQFNDPPVHTFLSVNGVNAGVGAVPYCQPKNVEASTTALSIATELAGGNGKGQFFSMCDLLMEQASRSAYTEFAQEHSFQANYWRDPRPSAADLYHKYGQLAVWNNEIPGAVNETLKENWARTSKFVWVMALDDGMVWPKEGEQWGAPDPSDPFHHVLDMKETDWYQRDLFGLKAAEEAGKNHYESFPGDHLQFKMEDFDRWVKTYLAQNTTRAMTQ